MICLPLLSEKSMRSRKCTIKRRGERTNYKEMTETKGIFYFYKAHESLREAMGVQEEYRTRTLFGFFGK